MCNKASNTSLSPMQFVPECYNVQQICVKAVDTGLFAFKCVIELLITFYHH